MKIAIGSDHAGFVYKQPIIKHLQTRGIEVFDFGTNSLESTDYPIYAFKVAEAVRDKLFDFGILICGTGIGMSIAANKVKGIRACACQTEFVAKAAKEHNNANVLCLGSRTNTLAEALHFVDIYLDSSYSNGVRHNQRLHLIQEYEENK
ncbi:MAG: ribose 5-phosphate isomerase B [Firmicutes bacterium]|nr:ribose 5-phosphate isomerase B [Bacillota bacterium]